jgi:WD40 repeat protein
VRYRRRDRDGGLPATLRRALGADVAADAAAVRAAWFALEGADRRVVAILDQAEEVFTQRGAGAAEELGALAADLVALFGDGRARPRGSVVLAFRKEWLPELVQPLREARLPYREVFLERLGKDGVIDAVTGPASSRRLREHYRLHVQDAPALAVEVADDLLVDPDSPVAPTLQVLLTNMWEEARARGNGEVRFDAELYRALRDRGLALARFLDQQLARLPERLTADGEAAAAEAAPAVAAGLAIDLLASHTTDLGTARARTWEETATEFRHHPPARLEAVVRACVNVSLLADAGLRGTGPDARPTRTLAHDTLAPLVRRLAGRSDLPGQRARRILEGRFREWADAPAAAGRTLDDADLATVESGRDGMRAWTDAEEALVAASRDARARCEEERRQAEAERQAEAGRRRWRRRATVATALVVAALGAYAGVTGRQAQRAAERARTVAVVGAAAGQEDPLDGALLLATLDPEQEPEGGLQGAVEVARHPVPARLFATWGADVMATDPLAVAAFSPDGRRVAIATANGRLRVWAVDRPDAARTLGRAPPVQALAFSDDGARVLAADYDSVYAWDAAGPDGAAPVRVVPAAAATERPPMRSSSGWRTTDGTQVTVDERHVVRLATGGRAPLALAGHGDDVHDVAVARAGDRVVTASADGTARLWDVANPSAPLLVLRHDGPVLAAALHGDSVLTVSAGGVVRVWSAAGPPGSRPLRLPHLTRDPDDRGVWQLAFSADGRRVAAVPRYGPVRVWRTDSTGAPVVFDRAGCCAGRVLAAGFSPEGRRVLTVSADDTLRVWSADGSTVRALPIGSGRDSLVGAVVSPDGTRVLTVAWVENRDASRVRVWSADGIDTLAVLRHPRVRVAQFSRDGRRVVTGGEDGIVRVWRADTAAPPREFGAQGAVGAVGAVAFSPDARHVVGAGQDGVAWVWAVDSGAPPRALGGHRARVSGAAVGASGAQLVTVARDGIARLWPLQGAGPPTPVVLRGGDGPLTEVAFSPDGRHVAAGSADGTVRLWLVRWPDLVAALRGATTVCLDEAKRRAYLGQAVDDARRDRQACERRGREGTLLALGTGRTRPGERGRIAWPPIQGPLHSAGRAGRRHPRPRTGRRGARRPDVQPRVLDVARARPGRPGVAGSDDRRPAPRHPRRPAPGRRRAPRDRGPHAAPAGRGCASAGACRRRRVAQARDAAARRRVQAARRLHVPRAPRPGGARAGVVAPSSGNHAQAVALAARLFGVPATVVMPVNAPDAKRRGAERLGARVELAGRTSAERAARADAIVADTGAVLVPPFDHPDIVAGQGTIGLEIAEDRPDVRLVLVPVGGGGLSAGVAAAVKLLAPTRASWASSRRARPSCRARARPARRSRCPTPRGWPTACSACASGTCRGPTTGRTSTTWSPSTTARSPAPCAGSSTGRSSWPSRAAR